MAIMSTRATARVSTTFIDKLYNILRCFVIERQIMRLVGKYVVESPVRVDPFTCAEKEKEGVFDFDAEMAQIDAALQ